MDKNAICNIAMYVFQGKQYNVQECVISCLKK